VAGYEWTNWSRIKDIPIVNKLDGVVETTLNFRYRDGHFYSLGAEYQWSPRFAVRAGVAYEESPITNRTRSVNIPDNDRVWASIGASYKVTEKLSVDASYSHISASLAKSSFALAGLVWISWRMVGIQVSKEQRERAPSCHYTTQA
jgi:long-chain fatty acid transport protein